MHGFSTHSVDDEVQAMGMTGISKSQVSRLCAEIDDKVKAFLGGPIEGDWPYLWIDATYVKVRQQDRIVSVAVIVAVGVSSDGRREVLGMDIGPSEAETFWTAFLRKLARRGRAASSWSSPTPKGHQSHRRQGAQRQLAALPRPLHAQPAGACRQERPAHRLCLRHRV
ncbi:transposase-like protein [Bradyrhizobium sp. IAR9]|nr:transposase-like protein [Bradyrhizobium sp. IAR9]